MNIPDWIDVKEKLPEKYLEVIAYSLTPDMYGYNSNSSPVFMAFWDGDEWMRSDLDIESVSVEGVTHWTVFPDPPVLNEVPK